MDAITIRPAQAGETSLAASLQMKLYERRYGFKAIFEHYLLASMAEFLAPGAVGRLWVALDGDRVIGSVAIVQTDSGAAQLRWFFVDERYQGHGVGQRLMDAAMRYCAERGYGRVFLWTLEILDAARHLYERYGFSPTGQKPNTEWTGELLMEEKWEVEL